MGRFFWVVTIASSFLGGTFPILGGAFSPFQILTVMGVAKFIVEDVVMRRTRTMPKSRFDLLMIAGFMGVVTIHALHDRFGMRFLGSDVWGGHNYVNVFVGLAAFFVIQSIPMQPKVWAKLPYVVLAVTMFDLLIAAITTIFPSLIFKIYPYYSAVSVAGIEEALTGESLTGRVGSFGNFGFILILLVLASIPLSADFKSQEPSSFHLSHRWFCGRSLFRVSIHGVKRGDRVLSSWHPGLEVCCCLVSPFSRVWSLCAIVHKFRCRPSPEAGAARPGVLARKMGCRHGPGCR